MHVLFVTKVSIVEVSEAMMLIPFVFATPAGAVIVLLVMVEFIDDVFAEKREIPVFS